MSLRNESAEGWRWGIATSGLGKLRRQSIPGANTIECRYLRQFDADTVQAQQAAGDSGGCLHSEPVCHRGEEGREDEHVKFVPRPWRRGRLCATSSVDNVPYMCVFGRAVCDDAVVFVVSGARGVRGAKAGR
jgi:hypothetical protein